MRGGEDVGGRGEERVVSVAIVAVGTVLTSTAAGCCGLRRRSEAKNVLASSESVVVVVSAATSDKIREMS